MQVARKGIWWYIYYQFSKIWFDLIAIFSAILEHIDSSNTDKNGENKFNQNFPLDSGVLDSRCGKGCIPFMEVKKSCIIRFCESYKNTSKSFSFFDRDEIASLTQKKFLIFWVKPNNFFYKILAEAVCFSDRNPRMILEYKNTWYLPEKHVNTIILMTFFILL